MVDQPPERRCLVSVPAGGRRLRGLAVGLTALAAALCAPVTLAGPAQAKTVNGAGQVRSVSTANHAPARYVALGDSYASGEGLPPYQPGTNTATDQCHRSRTSSYPKLLQASPLPQFDRLHSVACSGAMTGALLRNLTDESDEPPQLNALTRSTRTVTLTIGGNDAGFSTVLGACIYTPVVQAQALIPGRPDCRDRLNSAVSARIDYLGGQGNPADFPGSVPIATILTAIHMRSPHAKIYVTGYPRLFGQTFDDAVLGCRVGVVPPTPAFPQPVPLYVDPNDAQWIAGIADRLNATIASAVRQANQGGIRARFVRVAGRFTGHEVCDTAEPWINPVVFDPTTSTPSPAPSSFHPTEEGQEAYAAAVARVARLPASRSRGAA